MVWLLIIALFVVLGCTLVMAEAVSWTPENNVADDRILTNKDKSKDKGGDGGDGGGDGGGGD